MITITPVRAFKDNYIWLLNPIGTPSVWVVDPGDAQPVLDFLQHSHLTLAGILITHHHADHSGGISELIHAAGQVPVWGSVNSPVPTLTHRVKQGDHIISGALNLSVIEIPGHTLDHIAYYGHDALFCGDTLFSAGCGRVFEGTDEQMYASLNKLAQLPDQTQLFCGHEYTLANLHFAHHIEPQNQHVIAKIKQVKELMARGEPTLPSRLSEEKQINPFLRCHERAMMKSIEQQKGVALSQPVNVFSYLRDYKNQFK
jgi:hydroxyacylglutathione hydrolase